MISKLTITITYHKGITPDELKELATEIHDEFHEYFVNAPLSWDSKVEDVED